jgi:hypothetical protein
MQAASRTDNSGNSLTRRPPSLPPPPRARLSTAKGADRVAVISGGGIAELGSHDELLALGGRYADMYAAWEAERGELSESKGAPGVAS